MQMILDHLDTITTDSIAKCISEWSAALMGRTDVDQRFQLAHSRDGWARALVRGPSHHVITRMMSVVETDDFCFLTAVAITCPMDIPPTWDGGPCLDRTREWLVWLKSVQHQSRARNILTEIPGANWRRISLFLVNDESDLTGVFDATETAAAEPVNRSGFLATSPCRYRWHLDGPTTLGSHRQVSFPAWGREALVGGRAIEDWTPFNLTARCVGTRTWRVRPETTTSGRSRLQHHQYYDTECARLCGSSPRVRVMAHLFSRSDA